MVFYKIRYKLIINADGSNKWGYQACRSTLFCLTLHLFNKPAKWHNLRTFETEMDALRFILKLSSLRKEGTIRIWNPRGGYIKRYGR